MARRIGIAETDTREAVNTTNEVEAETDLRVKMRDTSGVDERAREITDDELQTCAMLKCRCKDTDILSASTD